MDRRHLLRVLGAAATAAGLPIDVLAERTAALGRVARARAWFTAAQRDALTAMVDAILPTTDTPGAVEAGGVEYLEVIVGEWMTEAPRTAFMAGLQDAMARAGAPEGASRLDDIPATAWTDTLRAMEQEGRAARAEDPEVRSFFHDLRALTLHGYYTSEIGMMEELLYRPLPGRYEGCVDLTTVSRAGRGGL